MSITPSDVKSPDNASTIFSLPMDSEKITFDRSVAALMESTLDDDISEVLSIIKSGIENQSKREKYVLELARRNGSLECLVTRLPNDEENMSLILSILADLFTSPFVARDAVERFDVLEHVSQILKTHRQDKIINGCLQLIANFCLHNKLLAKDVFMNESNLSIIESIVNVSCLVLEQDMPSKSTVMISLSSLDFLLKNMYEPARIVEDYPIIGALSCIMIKFIDDWKITEENHDVLTIVMQVLQLCSKIAGSHIYFELQNAHGGDAMLLLSDLIVMPVVSWTVKNIVLNLQKYCKHYSNVPFDDICGKVITKLRNLCVYKSGTENQEYTLFLRILCQLSTAKILKENLMVTITVSLLDALLLHVQPTEISFINCQMIITTLQLDQFNCCLRLMLDSGILSILSSILDWIFGVKNQLDFHHQRLFGLMSECNCESQDEAHQLSQNFSTAFEFQFYGNLKTSHLNRLSLDPRQRRKLWSASCSCTLSQTDSWEQAANPPVSNSNQEIDNKLYRMLAREILNLIECFTNLESVALELGISDIVYKLLLFFLPKNKSFQPPGLVLTIKNIIKKPEHLINLLMQTQFVYMTNKLLLPIHNANCVTCAQLFFVGQMIMRELTKVVEHTSVKNDIAHHLCTSSPTVKEKFAAAVPFLSDQMSTLNNLMIKCGGLDVLIDIFRREKDQREFIICSLKVLAQNIKIKDPTDYHDHKLYGTDEEVVTVLNLQNYQPGAGCTIVTFKLDDDSCLQADYKLLVSKSDYFNRLVFDQFIESQQEVVRLSKTPHDSFKLILMLLQLNIESCHKLCRNDGKLLEHVELPVVLEMIALSDQFLLKELSLSLKLYVQHCKFSPESALIIYRWSLNSLTDILRSEIVSYCLVERVMYAPQLYCFEELLKSECSEQLFDDMKNMFRKFLSVSCE